MSQTRHLKPSLPTLEITVYTASWILGVGVSIYHVYLASRKYARYLPNYDFQFGWFGPSNWKQDISNSEWHVFSQVILDSFPWLALHFLGSQYLRKFNARHLLPTFYLLLSCIYITKLVGFSGLAYFMIQPCLIYLTYVITKKSIFIYFVALGYTILQDVGPLSFVPSLFFDESQYRYKYIGGVVGSWISARCMSFCLDSLWDEVPRSSNIFQDFQNLLSYCFYLPLLVSGPIVTYKEYHQGINTCYSPWGHERRNHFALELFHFSFWLLVNNLILHVFYFNALQYVTDIMVKVDLWTLCGIGYCMGQFFHMKYLVFYGMPKPFLYSDEIASPSTPKCIGRIHLYSDMWRYFDNGLYIFIQKYFYRVLVEKIGNQKMGSRFVASGITFVFVYIWHGIQNSVGIWSVLNFLGISLENFARYIDSEGTPFSKFEKSALSPRGRRRFYALLGAPLFMMSILSNFYFFMGVEVGNIFVVRSCSNWKNWGTPIILFFMYCGAQTSYEMKNWEIKRQILRNQKQR